MNIAQRSARTVWEGPLATGSGRLNSGTGALPDLTVTWAARTEQPGAKTSPEERAAAAHSSCSSMALAVKLVECRTPPQWLDMAAAVTLDEVDGLPTIVSSTAQVTAQVIGIDAEQFQRAVDETAALCLVSRLFAGAQISVPAVLEPAAAQ